MWSRGNVLLFRFCFNFFQQAQQSLPVLTSSGRIQSVTDNGHVFLVRDIQYRVKKIPPEEGSIRFQKIICRDRPFKRSLKQIWLPPPATCEVSVTADWTMANCFCPESIPPQVFLDIFNSAVKADLPQRDAMDEWVHLMPDYSSVDNLEKAVSAICKQLQQSQLQLRATQQAEAALQSQVASLTADAEHLRSRLEDLNDTYNDLMTHSMAQSETIGWLRSQLTTKSSNAEPVLSFLRQLLLTFPTDFGDDLTPDDTWYHFLCCAPDADTVTFPDVLTCCWNAYTRTNPQAPKTLWFKQSATWWLLSHW